ncbi:hypothetical protein [Streptomyces sp. ISL-86]|uniref:hypothetical protein n=1 Tax=Streptomyces sp. ISL-86 TaxID=2819187 RepID=UPI001BE7F547|nr:hypothetical protein [Streptomyces sp. ISL-86]MBT2459812.1 hypothetical protein [Streptomyces sp. ISL-86]
MTQSSPQPPELPELAAGPDEAKAETTTVTAAGRSSRLVRLTREGRTRWVALGAVALVVGGGVAAVAVAEHHHGEHVRHIEGRFFAEDRGPAGAVKPAPGHFGLKEKLGERAAGEKERAGKGPGSFPGGAMRAPAPLPELSAGQAVEKAAGAVPGGKVESLRVIVQEGGGSAWRAVVLGSDGVRHAVTLAGDDGTVTGNTVAGEGPKAPR